MPLALPLLLLTHGLLPLDTSVTFSRTGNVKAMVAELSQKTGVKLSVDDRPGREILIVSVSNVPLADLMKQIGWSTFCKWIPASDGSYRLARDGEAEKAAEQHYVQWQTKEITEAIAKLKDRVLVKNWVPRLNKWEAEGRNLMSGPSLGERAAVQALAATNPKDLIFLRPDSPCVYSDQPSKGAHAFTVNPQKIMDEYNAGVRVGSHIAHMALYCDYAFETGTATFKIFDADGDLVEPIQFFFDLYPDPNEGRPKEFADSIPATMEVPLSENSKFFVRKIEGWWDFPGDSLIQKVPDICARLQNPEKYEPLASFATDVWKGVAAWQHRNLVANIDDVYMTPSWANKTPKLGNAFRQAGGYNSELQPGWLLARPSLPSPPWQHRADRSALGKLVRTKTKNVVDAFRATAEFAASADVQPDPYRSTQYMMWAGMFDTIDFRQWPAARVFGELDRVQQNTLLQGYPVKIADIPSGAKKALRTATTPGYDRYASNESIGQQPFVRYPMDLPNEGLLMGTFLDRTYAIVSSPNDQGGENTSHLSLNQAKDFIEGQERVNPRMARDVSVQIMPGAVISLSTVSRLGESPQPIGFSYAMANPFYHERALWEQARPEVRERIRNAVQSTGHN